MKPTAYSYSRLTTYDKCSQLYKLMYNDRVQDIRQDTVATRSGGLCHSALEQFYEDEDGAVESPYQALIQDGGIWDAELKSSDLLTLRGDLHRYASHMTKLYHRANASYKGPDPIRKNDGSVSTHPHMTTPWTQYVKQFGLDRMATRIDRAAAEANPKRWGTISLSDVYAQSVGIMYPYKNPAPIDTVLAIELPISEILYQAADAEGNPLMDAEGEPVLTTKVRGAHPLWVDEAGENKLVRIDNEFFLPLLDEQGKILKKADGTPVWSTTALFHGYIDMLARDEQGRLYIVDHKTSRELPTVEKVARHEQLLAYGYAIYFLMGEMPYAIAINHLRSNSLVVAPFNLEKAEQAIERLCSVIKGVESSIFIKRDPDGFNTPCMTKNFKNGSIEFCPGFKYCHPEIWASHHDALYMDNPF